MGVALPMKSFEIDELVNTGLGHLLLIRSSNFVPKVGLPAKSAVSGAILLVVPNIMGMMCLSPPLDKLGNSYRGVSFCQVSYFAYST